MEPVSVEIDSTPKLTPPNLKVAEEVETSISLAMKAHQDDAYPTGVSPQTPILIMDLQLRISDNIRESR